jgi:hypothetical protein
MNFAVFLWLTRFHIHADSTLDQRYIQVQSIFNAVDRYKKLIIIL